MEGRKGEEIIKAILYSFGWIYHILSLGPVMLVQVYIICIMYYCIMLVGGWWQWLQDYITIALYPQPITRILHCTEYTQCWETVRVIWTVIKLDTTLDLWVPRDYFLLRLTISQYVDIFINVKKGSEKWTAQRRPSFRSECPPVLWLMNRQIKILIIKWKMALLLETPIWFSSLRWWFWPNFESYYKSYLIRMFIPPNKNIVDTKVWGSMCVSFSLNIARPDSL